MYYFLSILSRNKYCGTELFGTGYEVVYDAERLSLNPVMRVITGKKDNDKQAASSNTIVRFEMETLNQWENNITMAIT